MDDFSDYPKSITEIKADNGDDASAWTARDALIASLRDIDSGDWKPKIIMIVGIDRETDGAYDDFRHFFAGGQIMDLIALVERAKIERIMDTLS